IRLLMPPRTFASSMSTSAQSSFEDNERSIASTCPRIRLIRATNFCFSFSICDIFPCLYHRGVCYKTFGDTSSISEVSEGPMNIDPAPEPPRSGGVLLRREDRSGDQIG